MKYLHFKRDRPRELSNKVTKRASVMHTPRNTKYSLDGASAKRPYRTTSSFQIRMHMVNTGANKTAPLHPRWTPFSPDARLPWKPADFAFAPSMRRHVRCEN